MNGELLARELTSKFAWNQPGQHDSYTKVTSGLSCATNVGIEKGLLFHIRMRLAACFRFEVMPGQVSLEDFKSFFWGIGHLKERAIPRRNCALIDQHIEIEDAVPV